MQNQKFGIEGLGKMEGIGKGPVGIFRKIGAEKNFLEHRLLLFILLLFLTGFLFSFIVKPKISTRPYKYL
jgi:hypothetical protein